MYHYHILLLGLLISFLCINTESKKIDINLLSQNNTGPQDRYRPVVTCFPQLPGENFPKCFVASGFYHNEGDEPKIFFNDLWRMDIDVSTLSVNWTQLADNTTAPYAAQGGFHQFWKKNATAFSWTAGLNFFDLSVFEGICIGSQIVTYDYTSLRYEVTVPQGEDAWRNMSSGACGKYNDDIYCYGGFNCTDFSEPRLFTHYNVRTNVLQRITPFGLNDMLPRTELSFTCITSEKKCLIGSGNLIEGGTVDAWDYYNIQNNSIQFFAAGNKPTKIEYLAAGLVEVWNVTGGEYTVIDNQELLITGGDRTSNELLTSNTIRYLARYNYKSNTFNEIDTCLMFTIKGEYLEGIPIISNKTEGLDEEESGFVASGEKKKCHYWIEYAGKEQNPQVSFHYPNSVVLYSKC